MKYPRGLHRNHNELPFLVEEMKIGRKEKPVPRIVINCYCICQLENGVSFGVSNLMTSPYQAQLGSYLILGKIV